MERLSEIVLISGSSSFEAACQIADFSEKHRARRLHGHSYRVNARARFSSDGGTFLSSLDHLQKRIDVVADSLDYSFLNDRIEIPTDENVARYIWDRLSSDLIYSVGLRSQENEGIDLDASGDAHVWRKFRFEAAHRLPNVPEGHKCGRMHGHGFEVIIHARSSVESANFGVEYERLERSWQLLHGRLHHQCLNEINGLENPTSELISRWIWNHLKEYLPELSWVTVYETATSGAHYDGFLYKIWKDFSIDSAVKVRNASVSDTRRNIHGHTFLCRLHLSADLDEILGWTVDYGDVKEKFKPVFDALDHRPLYEVKNLDDNDPLSIARWIRAEAALDLPRLERIDLFETRGSGVILDWGNSVPALPI